MVVDLDFLDVLQRLLNESLAVQLLLGFDQLSQIGLGLGMPGRKDGAAVLIGQDGYWILWFHHRIDSCQY